MPGIAICNSPILTCGAPIWTPAALSPVLWLGAYEEARAIKAAQPVLVDGACEDVTKWTAGALTTKSNQPGGVAGNCMRVLNAGSVNRYVYQDNIFITGNRYAVAGWGRGDGVSKPRVGIGSIGYEWTGTVSNDWQAIGGNYNATSDALFLYANGADAHYAEFDSLTLTNLSLTSYTPKIGAALSQATPTAMPWASSTLINGRASMQFANGDIITSADAASAWKFLHDGSAFTHIAVVRANAFPGQCILGQTVASLSLSAVGYGLQYNNAVSAIDLYIANGGGAAWAINDRFAAAPGAGTAWICTLRNDGAGNTVCWKNSAVMARTRYSGVPSYSAANPNTAFTIGVGADANMLDQAVYNRCLTDAEVTQAGQYLAAQWGITW